MVSVLLFNVNSVYSLISGLSSEYLFSTNFEFFFLNEWLYE